MCVICKEEIKNVQDEFEHCAQFMTHKGCFADKLAGMSNQLLLLTKEEQKIYPRCCPRCKQPVTNKEVKQNILVEDLKDYHISQKLQRKNEEHIRILGKVLRDSAGVDRMIISPCCHTKLFTYNYMDELICKLEYAKSASKLLQKRL